MNYPDKIIISGFSSGLGKSLGESLPPEKVFGITREICDIYKYVPTQFILEEYSNLLNDEKVALVLAAGTLGEAGGILNSSLSDWEFTFRTNLLGNVAIIKAFLPHMIKTQFGRIVFVSGGGAAYAFPLFTGYSLSKVAIVREVENISEELKGEIDDFSIIALAPGAMETKMLKKVREHGGKVKTIVDINETVEFIKNFISMDSKHARELSGKFIHVRDDLNSKDFKDKWLLRRIE